MYFNIQYSIFQWIFYAISEAKFVSWGVLMWGKCKNQKKKLCLGLCVSIELPLVTLQPVVQPTEEEVFDPSLNRFTAWCFYSCMICKVGVRLHERWKPSSRRSVCGQRGLDGQRPLKPEPGSSPHWPAVESRIIADILSEFQLSDMNPTCLNDSSDKHAPQPLYSCCIH